jgi:hypothetical protein
VCATDAGMPARPQALDGETAPVNRLTGERFVIDNSYDLASRRVEHAMRRLEESWSDAGRNLDAVSRSLDELDVAVELWLSLHDGPVPRSEEGAMNTGDLELQRVRAAQNQALFRQVNNQIDELNVGLGVGDEVPQYVCECLDRECFERISVPHDEYERIRRDPTEFFVVPGHEMPQVEEVVHRADAWLVVRKLGIGAKVAAEAKQ